VDALWELLAADETLFVVSDHSPAPPELKESPDFFAVWGGIAGVQSTVEVILTEALGEGGSGDAGPVGAGLDARGRPGAAVLERALSGAAAARFGLAGKGALAPGMDADLSLVEVGPRRVLARVELLDRHRFSPYVGRELTARIRATVLRGELVVRDGALVGPPRGRLITPSPTGPGPRVSGH
jgi:allantoinase